MLLSNELLVILVVALLLVVILVALIPRSDKQQDNHVAPSNSVIEEFPEEQVTVTLPPQHFPARVLRLPYAPPEEMRSDRDEFNPTTILLNVVVALTDKPDLLLTSFDPPLQLDLAFSKAVLAEANKLGMKYPKYGFWDGCKWVAFTAEKHQLEYPDEPHPTDQVAGRARVTLSQWSDPAMGRVP
jgi:hypothetical protein